MNPAGTGAPRAGNILESDLAPADPVDKRYHFARLAGERAWAYLGDRNPDREQLRRVVQACGAHAGRQTSIAERHYRQIAKRAWPFPGSPPTIERQDEWAAPPTAGPSHVGHRCRYCGTPAGAMDHVWPRSRGGDDHPNNLVPACLTCNSVKGGRSILGDRCPGCGGERHPGDVDTATGTAFYHCRCGGSWSRCWDLQHPQL